jgi:hypothetical protein
MRVPSGAPVGDLDGAHGAHDAEALAQVLPVSTRDERSPRPRDRVPDLLQRHPRVVRHRQRHEHRAAAGGQVAPELPVDLLGPRLAHLRRADRARRHGSVRDQTAEARRAVGGQGHDGRRREPDGPAAAHAMLVRRQHGPQVRPGDSGARGGGAPQRRRGGRRPDSWRICQGAHTGEPVTAGGAVRWPGRKCRCFHGMRTAAPQGRGPLHESHRPAAPRTAAHVEHGAPGSNRGRRARGDPSSRLRDSSRRSSRGRSRRSGRSRPNRCPG